MSLTIQQRLTDFFQNGSNDIICVYLFGSYARGEADNNSDIDVGVLYQHVPVAGFETMGIPLAGELERLLKKKVDVVVMNSAPVDLIHRILRDSVLVFERDLAARVRFEVVARNKYFDLKPILDLYRRAV